MAESIWDLMQEGDNVVILALLDCSKAYDRMDRRVLLDKLYSLGVTGRLFEFVCGFFFRRGQRVEVDNEFSETLHPIRGGPQGSALIMLIWLVYINDITSHIRSSSAALFLDDVAIWISHKDPAEAVRLLNGELARIYDWFVYNTVVFDAKKFHLFNMGETPLPDDFVDKVLLCVILHIMCLCDCDSLSEIT